MTSINAKKNTEVSKNSGFIFKVEIDPVNNIFKEKMEPDAKVQNWVLATCYRRGMVQKVMVFTKHVLEAATGGVL